MNVVEPANDVRPTISPMTLAPHKGDRALKPDRPGPDDAFAFRGVIDDVIADEDYAKFDTLLSYESNLPRAHERDS